MRTVGGALTGMRPVTRIRAPPFEVARMRADGAALGGAGVAWTWVVAVPEGQFPLRRGASAEGQIALGHEDEVAVEATVLHVAAAVDRRQEGAVRTEGAEGGGAGVELCHRGGSEELIGIAGEHDLAGLGLDDQDA